MYIDIRISNTIQLSTRNDYSLLCYDVIISHQKNLQIDKFDGFVSDINYNSKTDAFRDVIYLMINRCDPRPKGFLMRTQNVRQPRSASKRNALVIFKNTMHIF